MNPRALPVLSGAICLGAAVRASWRWDTSYHRDVAKGPSKAPTGRSGHRMRTQAHRIVDTDPKRGNVVVRVTGTRHDEPAIRSATLPNTQEAPSHDHHTNRVRETGSGSHGPILRSVPTNRLSQHLNCRCAIASGRQSPGLRSAPSRCGSRTKGRR